MTKNQILKEAMTLDPTERDEVAEAIWQSIGLGELTAEQVEDIHRRLSALDSGEALPLPGEQVTHELRQRFQR